MIANLSNPSELLSESRFLASPQDPLQTMKPSERTTSRVSTKVPWQRTDHRSDVNVVGGTYGTALQAAAVEGEIEATRLLLDASAEINIVSVGRNGSALFAAVGEEKEDVVKLLIERGADVNLGLTKDYDCV